MSTSKSTGSRVFAAAFMAALALASGTAEAQRHYHRGGGYHGGYYHRGGGWGPGPVWGGVGLGLGFGIGTYYLSRPNYVVVDTPPTVVYAPPPVTVQQAPQPVPRAAPAQPDPIFYPRNGQSPVQTEADRQDCNRWATTQPSAMADASVFHRATLACMDGRGYTSR